MQSFRRIPVIIYRINKCQEIAKFSKVSLPTSLQCITSVFQNQTCQITTANVCNSKAKNKGSKDKKNQAKVEVNSTQLSDVIDYPLMIEEFQSSVNEMKEEFAERLSLRNAAGSLEQLKVKHFNKVYELQEIAEVVRKNPKTVVLNMDAFPHLIPFAAKAISESGMNLNPQQEGTALIVPIPKITTEFREGLAKNAKILFNKYNKELAVTEIEFIKLAKKNPNKLSEDLIFSVTKQISAVHGKYHTEAKFIYNKKIEELMGK